MECPASVLPQECQVAQWGPWVGCPECPASAQPPECQVAGFQCPNQVQPNSIHYSIRLATPLSNQASVTKLIFKPLVNFPVAGQQECQVSVQPQECQVAQWGPWVECPECQASDQLQECREIPP